MSFVERQSVLKLQYFFTCQCESCTLQGRQEIRYLVSSWGGVQCEEGDVCRSFKNKFLLDIVCTTRQHWHDPVSHAADNS